jgi:antitoxin component YwqK of YwqJK toxin-antitoxin module
MDKPYDDLDLDDTEVIDRIISKAAEKLVERRGLMFKPKKQTPYTGWYVKSYEDDAIELLQHYRDGKRDGLQTEWYMNGQKKRKLNYKDGKLVTAIVWKPNGEKCPVTNVVNGNGVLVVYVDDGSEIGRITYKDGKKVETKPTRTSRPYG